MMVIFPGFTNTFCFIHTLHTFLCSSNGCPFLSALQGSYFILPIILKLIGVRLVYIIGSIDLHQGVLNFDSSSFTSRLATLYIHDASFLDVILSIINPDHTKCTPYLTKVEDMLL